jgi:SOS response regulatory protein OraA/RecX
MALLLSNVPHIAFAESRMISTSQIADDLSRAEAQQQIDTYLKMPELRKALTERGVSPDEISQRLASLSDSEMRQMATDMNQARYGGDILITILIVVLIIFLIKRI